MTVIKDSDFVRSKVAEALEALQSVAALDRDELFASFVFALCDNRDARTEDTMIPEDEMGRLFDWVQGLHLECNLLALVLEGQISVFHADGESERTFKKTDKT